MWVSNSLTHTLVNISIELVAIGSICLDLMSTIRGNEAQIREKVPLKLHNLIYHHHVGQAWWACSEPCQLQWSVFWLRCWGTVSRLFWVVKRWAKSKIQEVHFFWLSSMISIQ